MRTVHSSGGMVKIKATSIFAACLLLAGALPAAVFYQDKFDNDTLGVNNGIGGGATNRTILGSSYWSDDGDLAFASPLVTVTHRAAAYSANSWSSTNGFHLVVFYTSSRIDGLLGNRLSFGLISTNTDLSAYTGLDLFGVETNVYSIGANVTALGTMQGLNFANGSSVTNLDTSGNNVQFVTGNSTPVLISVLPDGSGGANWSYSINGINEASGNIATFDFANSYRFAAYAQDNEFVRSIQSVTLYEASGENLAPVAGDQNVTTPSASPKSITLIGVDPEGSNLMYSVVGSPVNGELSGTAPNLTYTPTNGYLGADSFTFTVNDGELTSALATVLITVTNFPPVAVAQNVQTLPDTSKVITLTGSDSDGPSNLTYTVVDSPTNGVLTGATNTWTYTPNGGFSGNDSFTFTVNDGELTSAPATVSILVTNNAPVATEQVVSTPYQKAIVITLTGSNSDGPSNLTYSVVNMPTNGVLTGATNKWTYTPNNGFTGNDSFTFTVNDGLLTSAPAAVSITVFPAGVTLIFTDLNSTLTATNTLKAGGSTNNVVVTGGVANNNYLYTVTYSGTDYDDDKVTDTLTFDVLVEAWSGGSVTSTTTAGTGSGGTAILGTQDLAVTKDALGWAVNNTSMDPGETLQVSLQNFSLSLTDASKSGSAVQLGFTGGSLIEGGGSTHRAVIGLGTGLPEMLWSTPGAEVMPAVNTGSGSLYISSATTIGTPSQPQNWRVQDVDFKVIVQIDTSDSYMVTGSAVANGTVTPAGTNVAPGGSAVFTITADPWYRINTVTTNEGDIGVSFDNLSTNYEYTWANVQATGTLTATFIAQVTTNAPAEVPYKWLADYGITTNQDAAANIDEDQDGHKTWQEYIANTDPTNKASVLKVVQSPRNVVTWIAQPDRTYSVYWSTNLVKGFSNLADNATSPYTNQNPGTKVNHYQVRVEK